MLKSNLLAIALQLISVIEQQTKLILLQKSLTLLIPYVQERIKDKKKKKNISPENWAFYCRDDSTLAFLLVPYSFLISDL